MLFDIATKKQTIVPSELFPNAYDVSPLVWRKNSAALTFEYNQPGISCIASSKSTPHRDAHEQSSPNSQGRSSTIGRPMAGSRISLRDMRDEDFYASALLGGMDVSRTARPQF